MKEKAGPGEAEHLMLTGWRHAPLNSVAEVRFSNVDKITHDGEIPVRLCNYTDVYNNEYIVGSLPFMRASATKSEIAKFKLRKGDVIITKDSETPDDIGIPAVVDEAASDLVCGYHLALIRPELNEVDPTFLAKQLAHSAVARYFACRATGSTRYGLANATVESTPLLLPPLRAQQKVSSVIRQVDLALSRLEALSAKYARIRSGLMHDLLAKGVDQHGRLRDLNRCPVKDSPLGPIPENWGVSSIGEACDIFSGATPARNRADWWTGRIPFLTAKDMKSFELADTTEHLSTTAAATCTRVLPSGTVFVLVRGMALAHSFPVCICTQPFAFNQDIKGLCPKKILRPRFLAHWLVANEARFLRLTSEATHGTKKLDTSAIRNAAIGIPSNDEQQTIETILDGLTKSIAGMRVQLRKLLLVKQGLMQDLLTGKVRVEPLLEMHVDVGA